MKEAMSAESLALWNKNVTNYKVTYLNEKGEAMSTAAGIDLMFVKNPSRFAIKFNTSCFFILLFLRFVKYF